ncbi:MAG: type IV secretory system conjugative DNA transfer family protein [Micromonosporaceae bacterium]
MNPRGTEDYLANMLLGLLVAAAAVGGLLWVAAQAAAVLGGAAPPTSGLLGGSVALADNPADPAAAWGTDISAGAYWVLAGLLVAVLAVAGWALWRVFRFTAPRRETDPHKFAGLPTGRAAVLTAGEKALVSRATVLRPSLTTNTKPGQVGYLVGRVRRRSVWLSVEDSLLVLSPPRSGKGMNCVVPMIVEAPGAVVTTSLFTDNIALTMRQRERRGPDAVFAGPWLRGAGRRAAARDRAGGGDGPGGGERVVLAGQDHSGAVSDAACRRDLRRDDSRLRPVVLRPAAR